MMWEKKLLLQEDNHELFQFKDEDEKMPISVYTFWACNGQLVSISSTFFVHYKLKTCITGAKGCMGST
jgi:hypothetical protein